MRKIERTIEGLNKCMAIMSGCDNALAAKFGGKLTAGAKAWIDAIRKQYPAILEQVYGLKNGKSESLLEMMDGVVDRMEDALTPDERYIPDGFYRKKPKQSLIFIRPFKVRRSSRKAKSKHPTQKEPPRKGYWHFLPLRPSFMLESIIPRDVFNRPQLAEMTEDKWKQLDKFLSLFKATLKSRRGRLRIKAAPERSPNEMGILYLCLGRKRHAHGHYRGTTARCEWLALRLVERLGQELGNDANAPIRLNYKRVALSLYGKSPRKQAILSSNSSSARVLAVKANRFLKKVGIVLGKQDKNNTIGTFERGFCWLPPEGLRGIKRLPNDYHKHKKNTKEKYHRTEHKVKGESDLIPPDGEMRDFT